MIASAVRLSLVACALAVGAAILAMRTVCRNTALTAGMGAFHDHSSSTDAEKHAPCPPGDRIDRLDSEERSNERRLRSCLLPSVCAMKQASQALGRCALHGLFKSAKDTS